MEHILFKDITYDKLKFLASEIKSGKTFIFPTSTVYGIGTNAFNKDAVDKIYKIKKREYSKPLIVLASDMGMVKYITKELNGIESRLVSLFWPGNLTLILRKRESIPDIVTSNKESVAIRIDENEFLNKLIKLANVPLVAPSANVSGKPCQTDFINISNELKESVDYIIDQGKIESGMESTIVKVIDNKVKILREGKISKEKLISFEFNVC